MFILLELPGFTVLVFIWCSCSVKRQELTNQTEWRLVVASHSSLDRGATRQPVRLAREVATENSPRCCLCTWRPFTNCGWVNSDWFSGGFEVWYVWCMLSEDGLWKSLGCLFWFLWTRGIYMVLERAHVCACIIMSYYVMRHLTVVEFST